MQGVAMVWEPRLKETRWHMLGLCTISLFVVCVFEPHLPSASAATLWSDVTALHKLREGWNATPGLAENWTWGSDPCWDQWIGVACFQDSVISLRLDSYGIVGTLSPSIGKLKNLLYLNLGCNLGLTGPIPEEIGNLSRLSALDLSNCSLSGSIPASLGNLRNASYIYLKKNQLTGEIPYTLGYLSNAFELSLGRNNLTGSIPVSSPNGFPVGLNNLTSLMILELKRNNLSGEIPPSLGQLQRLTTLLLCGNHFYGCLSCAMSNGQNYGLDNLTGIGLIDLSSNSFGGPLPEFLLKLPLINKLNLSLNQFTGVLDGSVRASGHVNVFLIDNNISAVANFPNPFIDLKLGGNPVCQNQSFPFADICQYSGAILKADTWQQQTSCTSICDHNYVAHPVTCKCSYPYSCNMFFGWSATYGLQGARIGHLRRELASELNVPAEDLWIDHAIYQDSSELKVFAKVLFFPATPTEQWDKSQITYIESQIVNKTIRLVGYDPYGILSSNLQSTPVNSGSSAATKFNHHTVPIIAGVIVGFVAMVTLSSLLVCFIKHKRRRPIPPSINHTSEIFDLNPEDYPSCLFPYDELKSSTRNFSRGNIIGEGSFGAVYKGTLRDCSEVAVKELPSNIKQGNQDFLNEVQLISSLEHRNLVKLRGCAISGNNRLLVYEYVENKCLAQAMFDPGTGILLEWPFRYNIALGLAKGLAFLHSTGPQRLAHGDIKANNVLLDNKLEPKIADFGLARMCQNSERNVLTRIEGKRGYVAPEFALHGQLTSKADVFSFGIIALELVSGRESMNSKLPAEEQYLLSWAWTLYEQRRVLELVDTKVRDGCDEEQALLLIKVALLCSQGDASSRPPMAKVVSFLSGDADVPGVIPERPAFLGLGVTDPNKPAPRPTSITTWK